MCSIAVKKIPNDGVTNACKKEQSPSFFYFILRESVVLPNGKS